MANVTSVEPSVTGSTSITSSALSNPNADAALQTAQKENRRSKRAAYVHAFVNVCVKKENKGGGDGVRDLCQRQAHHLRKMSPRVVAVTLAYGTLESARGSTTSTDPDGVSSSCAVARVWSSKHVDTHASCSSSRASTHSPRAFVSPCSSNMSEQRKTKERKEGVGVERWFWSVCVCVCVCA